MKSTLEAVGGIGFSRLISNCLRPCLGLLTSIGPRLVVFSFSDLGATSEMVFLVGVVDRVTDGVPGAPVHGLVTRSEGSGSEANVSRGLVAILIVPDSVY